MRKLIAALLLMTMLIPAALCEAPAEPAEATPAPLTASAPLSPELTAGGYAPDPNGFVAADPDAGVKAGYRDESLEITLEQIELDGVNYNVARVRVADASQLRTGLEDAKRGKKNNYVHNIAKKHNAVLAISGDFFSKNKTGYVVRMGETFRKELSRTRDVLLIDSNGDFHVIYQGNRAAWDELTGRTDITIPNIFNFGPVLVDEGKVVETPEYYKNTFNIKRPEPRCAIGQTGPLSYLLVVADGRSKNSDGATTEQLAAFMADQGCITAYNLDGGDTALMWFKDDYYSRETKRAQSDIIYFASAVNPDATEE